MDCSSFDSKGAILWFPERRYRTFSLSKILKCMGYQQIKWVDLSKITLNNNDNLTAATIFKNTKEHLWKLPTGTSHDNDSLMTLNWLCAIIVLFLIVSPRRATYFLFLAQLCSWILTAFYGLHSRRVHHLSTWQYYPHRFVASEDYA